MKVAFITPYPAPDPDKTQNVGMSWYSRNLIMNMPAGCTAVVLCDRIPGVQDRYDDEGVSVHRCWKPGLLFPFQVLRGLLGRKAAIVHIQHEVFLYGSSFSAALFPLLLLMVRLTGRKVVVTLHNGVLPRSSLSGEFLKENGIEGNPIILKAGLATLMRTIVLLSNRVIVHEEVLKETLVQDYSAPSRRVEVVPHGIEGTKTVLTMAEAKRALGVEDKKVILFLGYIAAYKNLDLLIESARHIEGEDWVMLIGGGEHPRLRNDRRYQEYVSALKRKAADISPDRIRFVGFISEEEVPRYVSAADVMVFPYKSFISASGPLTIAISYGRPILVSSAFRDFVASEEAVFKDDPKDLATKIEETLSMKVPSLEWEEWSRAMVAERQWSAVAKSTYEVYEGLQP